MNSKWLILIIYILNIYRKAPLEVTELKNYNISFFTNIILMNFVYFYTKWTQMVEKKT